ncbi:hypothetical protein FDT66_05525 [Polaribacter aestuariivivens]|uniref:Glycosyltransferase RgtA/B/C/D-like domain-containing protein n=1 Tax=Polaribacter aestuariivivens TaxID=2304626 RepID=A0A5S3N7U6_9FLAO|nr:hypothetical protein [Polaribacter aestuariivivens]TMM31425.1 hypothetical protein FDT66_05525 [Polaribacter aestuariivivens]
MFWDNVLFASKMGNHLYANSIFNWTIPNSFDPGHPPFLGFLLAIFWKILGHKLWVSHLLIFFFNFGFFIQLYKFISYFINKNSLRFFAFLIVIIDPTLSTAFVLVNPEIIILFFFLLAVNGILYKNLKCKFIGLFFLSIITFRSMMLFGGLLLFDVLNAILLEKKKIKAILNLKYIQFYFFASLPGVAFVVWRLTTKGWLQTHPDSPWASLWHFADFYTFIKNCAVLVWRYVDFGRVFIIVFILYSFIVFGKKIVKKQKNKQLFLLAITSVIFVIVTVLMATNAFGHRYFIISFSCLTLFAFLLISQFYQHKKIIYTFLFLGLITGNLWIYPKEISQGWDATLAHLPYHSLRLSAIDFLNEKDINIEEVATFFPNINSIDAIDFTGDKRSFSKFNGKNKYVFYATVYNLSNEELKILKNNYTILKQFNNFNINITIYIRK